MSQTNFNLTDLPVIRPRTYCILISRDPNCVYAYWDYTDEDINRLRQHYQNGNEDFQLVLRVYDITQIKFNGSNANHTWDIEVGLSVKNWYLQVWQDNANYFVELGFLSGNNFIPMVRSNTVHTPPKSISKRDDLIWQDIKAHRESQFFIRENKERGQGQESIKKKQVSTKKNSKEKVFFLSAKDIQAYYTKVFYSASKKSKGEAATLEDILQKRWGNRSWQNAKLFVINPDLIKREHHGASVNLLEKGPGVGSTTGASENFLESQPEASEGRLKKRKFFFEVWTELIVHGRTEPDATVWLNEQGIKLNPDGTFSLRYALVDGEIPLKFIAQSSDGIEQRHVNTRVERQKTIGFPKLLKEFNG